MTLFRKKPVVIQAEQWFPGKVITGVELRSGPGYTVEENGVFRAGPDVQVAVIDTLEGEMRVSPGDWIITGVKGEKYPCKPDIFEATYEREPISPIEPSSDKSLRDWVEVVGKQSDTIDNLIAASKLPMPADFHLTQIKNAMETMRDELREAYTGITGESPWSEEEEA